MPSHEELVCYIPRVRCLYSGGGVCGGGGGGELEKVRAI